VDDGEKFKEPTSVDDSKNVQQNTRDQPEPTKLNFRKKMSAAALSEAYTSETYRSSMFKLQVDELLGQVRLKYGSKEAPVEKALRSLKQIIEEIPAQEPLPVSVLTSGQGAETKYRRLTDCRSRTRNILI